MQRTPLPTLRGMWRDQVFADLKLPPSARIIGYAMGSFFTMEKTADLYRRKGWVRIFPSQTRLHQLTGLHLDTVRVAIGQLIERGHLKLSRKGNQFSGSNRYRVIFKEKA